VLGEIKSDGPAAAAGLRAGDRVLAVDGARISDAQTLRERIRAGVRDGRPLTQRWSLERDGRALELEVTPRVVSDGDATIGPLDAFVVRRPRW